VALNLSVSIYNLRNIRASFSNVFHKVHTAILIHTPVISTSEMEAWLLSSVEYFRITSMFAKRENYIWKA